MKNNNIKCGKAHAGNKTLHKTARNAMECAGCGTCYTAAEVAAAKTGNFAGRGLPYIVA
jgi:succinate dehydrogenase/fumarate reductase-like Fe-S protein